MSRLRWDDVSEWFELDGSLMDAYVLDTTEADWQAFVDLVRSRGWWYRYSVDSRPTRLPGRVSEIFALDQSNVALLLQIRPVPDMAVNVHFFTADEIEMDFDRGELQGQHRLDILCDFLRALGRGLQRQVALTPENGRHLPLVSYDVATDRLVAVG
jgi:hypothetical protein